MWYQVILLLRSASPRRCENLGRLPPDCDVKLRAGPIGAWRGRLEFAIRRVACWSAQLLHRPRILAKACRRRTWPEPTPRVAIIAVGRKARKKFLYVEE